MHQRRLRTNGGESVEGEYLVLNHAIEDRIEHRTGY
jgi:hypothetical protein